MLRDKDRELRRLKVLIGKYHKCLQDHDLTDAQIAQIISLEETETGESSEDETQKPEE